MKFINIIPIPYDGNLGVLPKEDYLAIPSNIARDIGLRSEIIVTSELKAPIRSKKDSNLKKGIKIKKMGSIRFIKYMLTHGNDSIVYANSRTFASLISSLFCRNSIMISHDSEPPRNWFRILIFKIFMNKFRYHRVNTPYEAIMLRNLGVKKDKIVYIPLSVDTAFFRMGAKKSKDEILKKFGLPKERKYLVYTSNYRSHKNPITAIKAMTKLSDKYVLVLIGKDTLQEEGVESIPEIIKKYEVEGKIFHVGMVSPDSVRELYKIADIYIHASFREGQCLAVYEAASAGLPLCLSSIGSFTSVFNGTALFHAPRDHKKLAENIQKYLKDTELSKKHKLKLKPILKRVEPLTTDIKLKKLIERMIK